MSSGRHFLGASRLDASQFVHYLRDAWALQFGSPPADLARDLEMLLPLFGPHAQGAKVREAAKRLTPASGPGSVIPERFFVRVSERTGLVTPEGRALIEFVDQSGSHDTDDQSAIEILTALADFYGRPARAWLAKQARGGDIRPLSVGFIVFLLINNSVGQNRALRVPNDKIEQSQLAHVVIGVADAFSQAVGGSPVAARERDQLRTSWVVTEAHRQMGQYLSRGANASSSLTEMWIDEDREDELIGEVGRWLAKRTNGSVTAAETAFDRAEQTFADGRPLLVSWGLAHDERRRTATLRRSLILTVTKPTE